MGRQGRESPHQFMKCEINEHEYTFHLKFIPETIAEASLLARIGLTRTQKTEVSVYFGKESPTMSVWMDQSKMKFASI